jgi:light-regulated signal transduction histidine kinase (bacteriophytochrome)
MIVKMAKPARLRGDVVAEDIRVADRDDVEGRLGANFAKSDIPKPVVGAV